MATLCRILSREANKPGADINLTEILNIELLEAKKSLPVAGFSPCKGTLQSFSNKDTLCKHVS